MTHDPVPAAFTQDLVRAVRGAGGQAALARRLGVSQSTVSLALRGNRFPLPILVDKLGWEKVTLLRRKKEVSRAG